MPASYPNYDYDQEQAQLTQRMKVMQALQEGALAPSGPTEVIGGRAIQKSPLEALAKVAQAYMGTTGVQSINDQQRDLSNRYRGDLKSGVSDFINGISAQPGTVTPEVQGNNPSAYVPPQTMTGDDAQHAKMTAILNAIGSNHPVLQGIGTSYLSTLNKDHMTEKDWLALADKFDPESVVAAQRTGNSALLKPKATQHVVGNQLVETTGKGTPATQVFDGRESYGPVVPLAQGPNGPIIGQLDKATGKAAFAPAGTHVAVTATATSKGEGKFLETLGEGSANDLIKVKQAKHDAEQTIASMNKLEQLDGQGVFSGPTAKASQYIGTLAESLGIPVDKQKIATSQAYEGEVMQNMQQFLTGSIARSTTDKDAEMLKAPLPTLMNSPEGRAALRRQVVAKMNERIDYANQVQARLERTYPEAARLNALTPGGVPTPPRGDVGKGKVRNYNPATGRIE